MFHLTLVKESLFWDSSPDCLYGFPMVEFLCDLEDYARNAQTIKTMEGREHTGQVSNQNRQERENQFREGRLAALFCSPTMELGIYS